VGEGLSLRWGGGEPKKNMASGLYFRESHGWRLMFTGGVELGKRVTERAHNSEREIPCQKLKHARKTADLFVKRKKGIRMESKMKVICQKVIKGETWEVRVSLTLRCTTQREGNRRGMESVKKRSD